MSALHSASQQALYYTLSAAAYFFVVIGAGAWQVDECKVPP